MVQYKKQNPFSKLLDKEKICLSDFENINQPKPKFKPEIKRFLPNETATVKFIRTKLEDLILNEYQTFYSPAQIRHPGALNWDIPEASDIFWSNLERKIIQCVILIMGVSEPNVKISPQIKFSMDINLKIDGLYTSLNWRYEPDRKEIWYVD